MLNDLFLNVNIVMAVFAVVCFVVSKIVDKYNSVHIDITKRMRNVNVTFRCERRAINLIKKGLNLIPVYILKKFDELEFEVYVLDRETFMVDAPSEDTLGYFESWDRIIVILYDSKSVYSEYRWLMNTFCHEFGHFIDYCYPEKYVASQRQDIQDAFESAKCSYADKIDSYYLSSSSEFFAYLSANYFTKAKFVEKRHKALFKEALATTFERTK